MGPFSADLPHDALAPMAKRGNALKKTFWRHAKRTPTHQTSKQLKQNNKEKTNVSQRKGSMIIETCKIGMQQNIIVVAKGDAI
jgi:hypothetical protein